MGKDDLMLDWAAQVQSWRRSMITFLGLPPRGWKLDEATAASAVTELPADVASVLGEDATDDDRAAALQGERKKDAAARFLQSRLKEVTTPWLGTGRGRHIVASAPHSGCRAPECAKHALHSALVPP